MSSIPQILIVGAGIAGLTAAARIAEAGAEVIVVDQSASIGGNFHRQSSKGGGVKRLKHHRRQWERIQSNLQQQNQRIEVQNQTRFIGLDRTGSVLLSKARSSESVIIHPRAVIMATGAVEKVFPREGWTLPGVMTAGAIQVFMKASGMAFPGRVMLGGSGALLYAVAAQMVHMGNPPIAIVDESTPFRHGLNTLKLPSKYLREGFSFMTSLVKAKVPLLTGAKIIRLQQNGDNKTLSVSIMLKGGNKKRYIVDRIGLHDGMQCNDYGLTPHSSIIVKKAGDCRETLGAMGAERDAIKVADELSIDLNIGPVMGFSGDNLEDCRRAQNLLKKIFMKKHGKSITELEDETIICRCENRTARDLRELKHPTERETRLVGRFAMGACQGRYCTHWVNDYLSQEDNSNPIFLAKQRWPVRPVSVESLIGAKEE